MRRFLLFEACIVADEGVGVSRPTRSALGFLVRVSLKDLFVGTFTGENEWIFFFVARVRRFLRHRLQLQLQLSFKVASYPEFLIRADVELSGTSGCRSCSRDAMISCAAESILSNTL